MKADDRRQITVGVLADGRNDILSTARDTIEKANQRIADAQKATSAVSDPALATTNAQLDESNDQLAKLLSEAGITNDYLKIIAYTRNVCFVGVCRSTQ